ncbi:unnamed protein product [Prunus brigantina]
MRTRRKCAPLLTLEETALVDKLQRISRGRSPPTRRLGSADEKVDPRTPMRRSISVANKTRLTGGTTPEVDQANSTPFTAEIEQTVPSKRFSTPSFKHFKWDSDPEGHLKHFKSIMIFYKANTVGCDDQIASSAFKKGLPAEHDLYRELTITPTQTLAELFATTESYALWDDDRITAKKSTK